MGYSCFCLGGVYNSPEANAYWARRFGSLFGGSSSGGLRQLQVITLILKIHEKYKMKMFRKESISLPTLTEESPDHNSKSEMLTA